MSPRRSSGRRGRWRALAAGVCFAVPGLATGVAARPQKTGITMGPR
ncbi:hypothetical protein OHB02_13510 [Streptomyces albidoflavus]|nr:hypothetical protein OIM90_17005 [Streptomyces sp. AD16]WSB21174.1 hypothetical protein OHB02_13510 [Streptomyces albidoflavus]